MNVDHELNLRVVAKGNNWPGVTWAVAEIDRLRGLVVNLQAELAEMHPKEPLFPDWRTVGRTTHETGFNFGEG